MKGHISIRDNGLTGDRRMELVLHHHASTGWELVARWANGNERLIDVTGDVGDYVSKISLFVACDALRCSPTELRAQCEAALPESAGWSWADATVDWCAP